MSGRAVSFDGGVNVTTPHNHQGDKSQVDLKRMQGKVQTQAMVSKEAPRAIIGRAIQQVPEETKPLIRRSLLARIVRRRRHEAKLEPANPKTLKELVVSYFVFLHMSIIFYRYLKNFNCSEKKCF